MKFVCSAWGLIRRTPYGREQIGRLMWDKMHVLAVARPSRAASPPPHRFSLFIYCFHPVTVCALKHGPPKCFLRSLFSSFPKLLMQSSLKSFCKVIFSLTSALDTFARVLINSGHWSFFPPVSGGRRVGTERWGRSRSPGQGGCDS